jgi:hypothetical protein
VTRLLPAPSEMLGAELPIRKSINTFRHAISIGITFPASNSQGGCRYHDTVIGAAAPRSPPPPARPSPFPGPGVTPPVMLGIMDLKYLDCHKPRRARAHAPAPGRGGYDDAGGLACR